MIPDLVKSRRRTRTYDVDNDNLRTEVLPALIAALAPVGSVIPTLSAIEPEQGWKLLNGQWIDKDAFPALFNAIGAGVPQTATQFQLPDMRGRIPIGAGPLSLLATAGAAEVVLTVDQLPSHAHTVTDPGHAHAFTAAPHTHSFTGSPHSHSAAEVGAALAADGADHPIPQAGVTGEATGTGTIGEATQGGTISTETTGISIGNAGGGQPVPILPPVMAVHWLVKT